MPVRPLCAGATDAARAAADIVLTQPGLSVVIHAIVIARCIFQRVKNFINCERSAAGGAARAGRWGAHGCWAVQGLACLQPTYRCALLVPHPPYTHSTHWLTGRTPSPARRPLRRPYRRHAAAADLLLHLRVCLRPH